VKRTQLYLDDDLWDALHARARIQKTTISDLVREAAREKYMADFDARRRAMEAFVGIWKDREDIGDPDEYVRKLRHDTRLKRLGLE
jgi:hypothetical protein